MGVIKESAHVTVGNGKCKTCGQTGRLETQGRADAAACLEAEFPLP